MLIFITSVAIAIVMLAVLWFVLGFLWFLFGMKIIIPPAPWHPPLWAKAMFVVTASFAMPWLFFTKSSLPIVAAMQPMNIRPEDEDAFREWQDANCPCDQCRWKRGDR
jgi:hypothetical protein